MTSKVEGLDFVEGLDANSKLTVEPVLEECEKMIQLTQSTFAYKFPSRIVKEVLVNQEKQDWDLNHPLSAAVDVRELEKQRAAVELEDLSETLAIGYGDKSGSQTKHERKLEGKALDDLTEEEDTKITVPVEKKDFQEGAEPSKPKERQITLQISLNNGTTETLSLSEADEAAKVAIEFATKFGLTVEQIEPLREQIADEMNRAKKEA